MDPTYRAPVTVIWSCFRFCRRNYENYLKKGQRLSRL